MHSFCARTPCTDGFAPISGLIQASDGNFYGTTPFANSPFFPGAFGPTGTIFRMTPAGAVTAIYGFCPQSGCIDGAQPFAGLVQGTDGNFYGTTTSGGQSNRGTVFRVTAAGALTTLHSFCSQPGCTDGAAPVAGLIQGSDGSFYGVTSQGGGSAGTLFSISSGGLLTTLHTFCSQPNCDDGSSPVATLIQASDGNFYGTTSSGSSNNAGTLFRLTPGGTFTTLYRFCSQSGCADGSSPAARLVQASDGNLYGVTSDTGTNPGTVFRITLGGSLTTLYTFCSQANCADGRSPNALIVGPNGSLYGTTGGGGTSNAGTVFRIDLQTSLTANPNPIVLAPGSTAGVTSLSWNAPGRNSLQIFVGSTLFAGGLASSGSVNTGNWATEGMVFSLIDPANGQTLATVTVHTSTGSGQSTLTANPNPITLAAGSTVGVTSLSWNAPGHNALRILAGSTLFADGLPSSGSAATGNWVSEGMVFSLIDPASGQTLATVTAHTTAGGGQSTLAANPNPIVLAAGSTVGVTSLSWNAPGRNSLQIFAGSTLFAGGLGSSGSVNTGNWVNEGMVFSLKDPANGQTLATVTVHTSAGGGQSTFTANPNPIILAGGSTVGVTSLSWNAPGHTSLQIFVGSSLFAGGLGSSGSVNTGNWVSNGMVFSLVDSANGQTVNTVTVQTQ